MTPSVLSPIEILANEVLEKAGNSALPEFHELVQSFKYFGNSTELLQLKIYLDHFLKIGDLKFGQQLLKIVKTNEKGLSILTGIMHPVLSRINATNIGFFNKLGEDEDLLRAWLKFIFASPADVDFSKLPFEMVKKFLFSSLCKSHQLTYRAPNKVNEVDLIFDHSFIFMKNLEGGQSIIGMYHGQGIQVLMKDQHLMNLAIDFNEKFPAFVHLLLNLAEKYPSLLTPLLEKALSSDTNGRVLNSLTEIDPNLFLKLFNHPNYSDKDIDALTQTITRFPSHANLLAVLTLKAWENPELADMAKLFSHEGTHVIPLLDLLSISYLRGDLDLVTPVETLQNIKELISIHLNELTPLLKRLKNYPSEFNEKLIGKFKELHTKSPETLSKILARHENLHLIAIIGRISGREELDLSRLNKLMDWIDKYPVEAITFTKLAKIYTVSDFSNSITHQRAIATLWLGILYFPEKLPSLVKKSQNSILSLYELIDLEIARDPIASLELEKLPSENPKARKEQNKAGKKLYVPHKSQKIWNALEHVLNSSNFSTEERHHFTLLIHNGHASLAHSLELYFTKNRGVAVKLLLLSAVQKEFKLTWNTLHILKAHPTSNQAKLFTRCLLENDIPSLKQLATLLKNRSLRSLQVQQILSQSETMSLREIVQNLQILKYGKVQGSPPYDLNLSNKYAQLAKEVKIFSNNKDVQQKMLAYLFVEFLSDQLVSSVGKIHSDWIPLIINDLKDIPLSSSYYNHIIHVLNSLSNNSHLIMILNELKIPSEHNSRAAFLLRASLGVSHDSTLSSSQLIKIVLTTLLLHTRQMSQVGSCVGSSQLNALEHNLEKAISILSKVLLQGGLEFQREDYRVKTTFSTRLYDGLLKARIMIDSNGKILDSLQPLGYSLGQHPGLLRIASFLKISPLQIQEWFNTALTMHEILQVSIAGDNAFSIYPKNLIKALVESARILYPELNSINNLLDLCEIIFLGTFDNLPSRVLENILISADTNHLIGLFHALDTISFYLNPNNLEKINASISEKPLDFETSIEDIFIHQIQNGEASPTAYPNSLKNVLKGMTSEMKTLFYLTINAFKKDLENSLEVAYDPCCPGDCFGRNILIEPSHKEGTPEAVDTPQKLVTIIARSAQKSIKNIEVSSINPQTQAWWDLFSTEWVNYISSDRFLNALVLNFSGLPSELIPQVKNSDAMEAFAPLNHLEKYHGALPWRYVSGANTDTSWYTINSLENHIRARIHPYCCHNATDIKDYLLQLLDYFDMRHSEIQVFGASIPRHAVNFIFNHPLLKPLIEAQDRPTWIEEACVNPAHQLHNNLKLTEKGFKRLCNQLKSEIPSQLHSKWDALITEKIPSIHSEIAISEIRKQLMQSLETCLGTANSPIFSKLETLLYKAVAQKNKPIKVLPFIDTNWYVENSHSDIFFALLFSPVSLEWELWQIEGNQLVNKDDRFFSTDLDFHLYFEA